MAATLPELARIAKPLVIAGERTLPVTEQLAGLVPGGALRRGSTVAVEGSTWLALALAAGPSGAGSWCAAVGLPALGAVAAAQAGVRLERLALVADPGRAWPEVTAALLDAVEVVLVRGRGGARDVRRLTARTRERGAVLVALGAWEGADVRLTVTRERWTGLGQGWGYLASRELEVTATGRGAAARPRRAVVAAGAA